MFSFSPNFIADIAPAAKKKSFKEPGIETQSTGKTNKGGKETLTESRKNLTCLTLCISNISVQLAQSVIKPTLQTQNRFFYFYDSSYWSYLSSSRKTIIHSLVLVKWFIVTILNSFFNIFKCNLSCNAKAEFSLMQSFQCHMILQRSF